MTGNNDLSQIYDFAKELGEFQQNKIKSLQTAFTIMWINLYGHK